jgi:acetyl/propionyl-CoA carboxylase alpha subunit
MQDVQGLNRVYAEQDVEVAHVSALDEALSLSSQPARPKPKTVAK